MEIIKMFNIKQVLASLTIVASSLTIAEPVKTTLKDYAFDFATVGYEISFLAETSYYSDPMSGNDYFNVAAEGYTVKARADKLGRKGRKGRKQFITYFNENCKKDFMKKIVCAINMEGEVELDDKFKMIIWATKIDFMDPKTNKVIVSFK